MESYNQRFTAQEYLEILIEEAEIRRRKSAAERQIAKHKQPKPDSAEVLKLENISCVSADGTIFEKYDTIYVSTYAQERICKGPVPFKLYDAISHINKFEYASFLPSLALTCNILIALHERIMQGEEAAKKILDQYCSYNKEGRWIYSSPHIQNTIFFYSNDSIEITHYPYDLSKKYCVQEKYQQFRHGEFKEMTFHDFGLEEAILTNFSRIIKNATGLLDPMKLMMLGKYFNSRTTVSVPINNSVVNETCCSTLGIQETQAGNSRQSSLTLHLGLDESLETRGLARSTSSQYTPLTWL